MKKIMQLLAKIVCVTILAVGFLRAEEERRGLVGTVVGGTLDLTDDTVTTVTGGDVERRREKRKARRQSKRRTKQEIQEENDRLREENEALREGDVYQEERVY